MKLLANLYQRTLTWARNPYAAWYLAAVSFAEASFFMLPPDALLVPMTLAKPARAWRYAALATLMSVLGSLLGYAIGFFLFSVLEPWLQTLGWMGSYLQITQWFHTYGLWIILISGVTPIPYKLFTITAGVMALPLLPFVAIALLSRAIRFFAVAGLIRLGGESLESKIHALLLRFGTYGLIIFIVVMGIILWWRW